MSGVRVCSGMFDAHTAGQRTGAERRVGSAGAMKRGTRSQGRDAKDRTSAGNRQENFVELSARIHGRGSAIRAMLANVVGLG
jgi:hypothetical protein